MTRTKDSKMISELVKQAGKTLWQEIGEDALKKGVGTVVAEGIKAVIDVIKQRKLKEQEFELKQKHKAAEAEMAPEAKTGDEPEEKAKEDAPNGEEGVGTQEPPKKAILS